MAELTGVRRTPLPAFSIEIENGIGNANHTGHTKAFESLHGDRLIANLLIQAGYGSGTWRFRLKEPFRASSHTPAIQVRHAEQYGVVINVKPGDNGSAVKGLLIVEKEKGLTPDEVYQKLHAITEAAEAAREETLAKPTLLTDRMDKTVDSLMDTAKLARAPSLLDKQVPNPPVDSAMVVLNKDKLQKLATLPDRIAKVRAEIKNAYDRKEKIEFQIMELEDQEKKLMSIDIGALAALLDSVE